MSDKSKMKSGVPTRDFKDDGTDQTFTKGKAVEIEEGAHANYLAAGLISEPEAKAPAKPAA